MTRIFRLGAIALACGIAGACAAEEPAGFLAGYDFTAPDVVQWNLPDRLREISGLAMSADGRLFGHDDETAIVYELDFRSGSLVKAFALGDAAGGDARVPRDDFEGIAWIDGTIYLVNSAGRLLRTREAGDGERAGFEVVDTGLAAQCEFEGLAHDARRGLLLLPCKMTRAAALEGQVAVLAWSIADGRVDPAASISVEEAVVAGRAGTRRFSPSAIELTPDGKHVLLLAGRQRALVELDLTGTVVGGVRLDKERHAQPEGLAIGGAGELIIADEGAKKKGRGRLAVYERR